jgi:hypothetical protein
MELFCLVGNHDQLRWDTRLAAVAPQFEGVPGFALDQHFPNRYQWAWSVGINDTIVCKHRWKGGNHAAFNNAVQSGKTCVTGHLHAAQISAYTDWSGTRWGLDVGMLGDVESPAFDYCEANVKNWRSGFALLTFSEGTLLWPELITKWDSDHICWRGKVIEV